MAKKHIIQFGMPYFPGVVRGILHKGLAKATADSIVLLSVSEIKIFTLRPAGFLIVDGAPFSHTMITLLGYGVPVVVINHQQASELEEGSILLLDGYSGRISSGNQSQDSFIPEPSPHPAGQPVLTRDGVPVNLCASVRSVESTQLAVEKGAQSIGLVRTEFLVPEDGSMPSSAYYQGVCEAICKTAAPLTVTFRLLDLAEDKMPAWMPKSNRMSGTLGLQGVRLYNDEPVRSVVAAQLSAINSLSAHNNIRVLIPYLVRLEELRYWRTWIEEKLSRPVEIGAMAETPASVLDIRNWFNDAEFVAIGCNDLMQCLFAAGRDRPELRDYLDPYAPILHRLLKDTAQSVGENINKVQLCGVLSQLPGILPLLIGLGYRTFSVDPHSIPFLAQAVRYTTLKDSESLAADICVAKESREVLDILGLSTSKHCAFLT
jgi:phosphoenolpyruvate-protein kinase (PTS system EI component)